MTPAPLSRAGTTTCPAELKQVVLKCLAKSPADRFSSVEELGNILQNILECGIVERKHGSLGNRTSFTALAALAMTAFIFLFSGTVTKLNQAQPVLRQPEPHCQTDNNQRLTISTVKIACRDARYHLEKQQALRAEHLMKQSLAKYATRTSSEDLADAHLCLGRALTMQHRWPEKALVEVDKPGDGKVNANLSDKAALEYLENIAKTAKQGTLEAHAIDKLCRHFGDSVNVIAKINDRIEQAGGKFKLVRKEVGEDKHQYALIDRNTGEIEAADVVPSPKNNKRK